MTELPTLPFDRPGLLGIAPRLRELQASEPVARVRTPAGDEAWLVSRYADVRALFAAPRLGRSHPKPDEAARISESALLGGAAGGYDTETPTTRGCARAWCRASPPAGCARCGRGSRASSTTCSTVWPGAPRRPTCTRRCPSRCPSW